MTVDLHPDCKARITELVSKALPLLDVEHGKFVKRTSEGIVFLFLADEALPQRGPLHETLLAYVDDYPPRHSYFVHRKDAAGDWQVERRLELDDSVSRGLERLQLAELVSTPEKQKHWCPRILEEIAHVVSAGKRSELIMLASQWYFDSATGSDRLLPFIQAMVVLEKPPDIADDHLALRIETCGRVSESLVAEMRYPA